MVRFKHRYLVATVSASPEQISVMSTKEIAAMLKDSIATNFGDFGAGRTSGLQVRAFDRTSGVCIVRAGTDSHRMIRACLTLLSGSKDEPLSVAVEAVTGCHRTLKGAAIQAYTRGYEQAGLDGATMAALLQQKEADLDMTER